MVSTNWFRKSQKTNIQKPIGQKTIDRDTIEQQPSNRSSFKQLILRVALLSSLARITSTRILLQVPSLDQRDKSRSDRRPFRTYSFLGKDPQLCTLTLIGINLQTKFLQTILLIQITKVVGK